MTTVGRQSDIMAQESDELDALAVQGISSGSAWDRAMMLYEEADRLGDDARIARDRESTLGLVITDKRIDLAHYRGVADYYRKTAGNRPKYFTELIGGVAFKDGEPNLEAECKWHATQ